MSDSDHLRDEHLLDGDVSAESTETVSNWKTNKF